MIGRRSVLAALAAAPLSGRFSLALAQSGLPVIGLLGSATPEEWVERLKAFRQGLAEAGFVEGKNVLIEYRWAQGRNERLAEIATEFAHRPVNVIAILGNTQSILAAKAATSTIPIVARAAVDPVAAGIVASLARPGGNVTGITTLGLELAGKHIELLHEILPRAVHLGLLVNPTNPAIAQSLAQALPASAQKLGVSLHIVNASSDADFNGAFGQMARMGLGGLILSADTFFNSRNDRLAALAIQARLPAISAYREFAVAGGLISYGADVADASRLAGIYVGRILKGEKPADLPFEQATRLQMAVNLKTAAALGLDVPLTVIARADEVIE